MYKAAKETKRWLNALGIANILFAEEGCRADYLEQVETFVRSRKMYSPRIKAELIPKLYHLAKARKIPMTRLVNRIIEDYLEKNGGKIKEGLAVSEAHD